MRLVSTSRTDVALFSLTASTKSCPLIGKPKGKEGRKVGLGTVCPVKKNIFFKLLILGVVIFFLFVVSYEFLLL